MLSLDSLKFQRQQLKDLYITTKPRETPYTKAWTKKLDGLHGKVLEVINEQRAAAHKSLVSMSANLCDLAKEVELPLILPENSIDLPKTGSGQKRTYGCCTFGAKLGSRNESRDPLAMIRESVSFRLDSKANQVFRAFSEDQSELADRYNVVLGQCDELINIWIDGLRCQMYSMRCKEVGIDVRLTELTVGASCRLYLIVCVIFDRPALYVQLALECERIWEGSYTLEWKQEWASHTLRKLCFESGNSLGMHIESVYNLRERILQLPDTCDEFLCIAKDANTLNFGSWMVNPLYEAVQATHNASRQLKFAAAEQNTLDNILTKIQNCAGVAKSDDHLADEMLNTCTLLDELYDALDRNVPFVKVLDQLHDDGLYELADDDELDELRDEVETDILTISQYLKSFANTWKSQNAIIWNCIEKMKLTQNPNGPDRLSALKESSDAIKKIDLESWDVQSVADQLHSYALRLQEILHLDNISFSWAERDELKKLYRKVEKLSQSVRKSKRRSGTEPSQVNGQVSAKDLIAAADDLQVLSYCEMIRRLSTATKLMSDMLKSSAADIVRRVAEPVERFSEVLAAQSKLVKRLSQFCKHCDVFEEDQIDRQFLYLMEEVAKQIPDLNKIPRIVQCEDMTFKIAMPELDDGIVKFYMNHLTLEGFINNLRTISSSYSSWSEKVPGSECHHQLVVDRINGLIAKFNTTIDLFLPLKKIFIRIKNLYDQVDSIVKLAERTDKFCRPLLIEATMLESEVNLLRRGVRAVTRQPTLEQEVSCKADELDALAANLKQLSNMAKTKTVKQSKMHLLLRKMQLN